MNRKYLWEDEFEISQDLDAVEEVADATYALQGTLGDSDFSEHISKMRLFYMNRGGESLAVVGCSEQLLDSCSLEKHDSMFVLKVYLKGEEPLANPVTGIYIASQDFPKSLIV